MLLDDLYKFDSVEEAAKQIAGNYLNWRHFVWFGEGKIPHSENIMLGYLVNNMTGSVRQEANAEVVKRELKSYWGDLTEGALVEDFTSSFCGDKDALSGLAIKVYDDEGNITKPFEILYELSLRGEVLDEKVYQEFNDKELRRMVDDVIEDSLKNTDPEELQVLKEDLFVVLKEHDEKADNLLYDDIEDILKELVDA